MNTDEIMREARRLHADWVAFESMRHGGGQGAKSDDGEAKRAFMLWLVDDFPVACDLIESLQAQLAEYDALAAKYGIDGKTMLTLAKSQIETALDNVRLQEALEDSQRREKGCEHCRGWDSRCGASYCPMCGKRLPVYAGTIGGEIVKNALKELEEVAKKNVRRNTMRLIDADALERRMYVIPYYDNRDEDAVIDEIYKAPTADAVPVVRCGECSKQFMPDCPLQYIEKQAQVFICQKDGDFCSYGEKMEDKP